MGVLDIFKKDKDGKLTVAEAPKFNRQQLRSMKASARHRPAKDRKFEADRQREIAKKAIAERVKRKQDAAHARALARKALKK